MNCMFTNESNMMRGLNFAEKEHMNIFRVTIAVKFKDPIIKISKMRNFPMAVCLIAFPLIVMVLLNHQDRMFNLLAFAKVKFLGVEQDSNQLATFSDDDLLLRGLLASGFGQESCLSRYQSIQYRKPSPRKPSPYLILKLRNYENLQKKCEPYTELNYYSRNISGPAECNFVVWKAQEGLGNRILSMASAFLYALLTNKVLLVEHNSDMADLFCEPFPNTSWLLPPDFPGEFRWNNPRSTFGSLLRSKTIDASMKFPPPFLYIFIAARQDLFEGLFYCEEYHTLLRKVPWLIIRSDKYFAPSFFLMPSFREELDRMFPDKETVFHYLARYLFHPSNKSWGLITRFYQSYLAKAEERICMQIRIFNPKAVPLEKVLHQVLTCTIQENLLPKLDKKKKLIASRSKNKTLKAVLIASLYSEVYENMTNWYWMFPTIAGDVVGVYQPSHERYQHFGDNKHNVKAWVEMKLLSLSNVLVTSSWSTFGYVAQGLGGLKPWILSRPEDWNTSYPTPACKRVMSMEPCLKRSPNYDCKAKAYVDMGNVVPHVKHCEDVSFGLKLVNNF